MITLLTSRVWNDIKSAAAKCKKPAHVAVAYFGEKGDSFLPIPAGSSLVVDASISTVAAGSTSPAALARLQKQGINIYSTQYLHAKVYVFDNVAYIGSANVSLRSEKTLIEAVLRVEDSSTITSARKFVDSLCLTKLNDADLTELSKYYKRPKKPTTNPEQRKFSTLLMELTKEQGGGRETQVQPPKAVWNNYFGIKVGVERLPVLTLINESAHPSLEVKRPVIEHDHNYTIELVGAELPRPAILRMRRMGHNRYSYRVHRPTDSTFTNLDTLLQTLHNPLRQSGRLWVMI
jgi:hypothetical protein